MKKCLGCLLLCALILTSCTGQEVEPVVTTESVGSVDGDTKEIVGRDAVKCSLPDDVKFDGETVNILVRDEDCYIKEVFAEQSGDVVDDAIYDRNLAVSERLGVKIGYTAVKDQYGMEVSKRIRESVLAGDEPYQLAFGAQYYSTGSALEGAYYNLLDMKYIDTTAPYYSQGFIDAATIHDTLFYITGDASITQTSRSITTFFNKKLAGTWLSDVDLYSMVRDGKWTWENFGNLLKSTYEDLNGNGERDIDDFYGLCTTITADPFDAVIPSCNIKIASVDKDGNISLTLNNERTVNTYEMLDALLNRNDGVMYKDNSDESWDMVLKHFKSSKSIFYLRTLDIAESDLRDFTDPYGILPIPKYDEAQENYYTVPHDLYSIIFVPANCSNPDLVSAFIDVMNYESYKKVTPAYFETALKAKYLDGNEDAEMYDMIVAGKCFDPAVIYSNYTGELSWITRNILRQNKTFASYYASIESSANEKLAEISEKLSELR